MYEAKEIRKKMMATYQRWFGFKDGTIRIRTGLPDFSDLRYEKHDWSHSTICWSQGETFNCSSSKQIIRRSKYRIMEAEGSRSLINVAINGDVQQALTSQFELLNINNIKAHTLTLSRFIMDSQPYCLVLFAALMII